MNSPLSQQRQLESWSVCSIARCVGIVCEVWKCRYLGRSLVFVNNPLGRVKAKGSGPKRASLWLGPTLLTRLGDALFYSIYALSQPALSKRKQDP